MNPKEITRLSHALSVLLRHGAGERGLPMDAAGWAPIDAVLAAARTTREALDAVVRENNKSRLEVAGGRIRACQGHSLAGMPVTLEALEASWALDPRDEPVWHGTHVDAVASIAREGILPGERTHAHLAAETDSKVGKRAGVDVMLRVDPARLRAEGIGLYRSGNGVLLARQVPASWMIRHSTPPLGQRPHPLRPATVHVTDVRSALDALRAVSLEWLARGGLTTRARYWGSTRRADTQHGGHLAAFATLGVPGTPVFIDGMSPPYEVPWSDLLPSRPSTSVESSLRVRASTLCSPAAPSRRRGIIAASRYLLPSKGPR